ncbi:MAG: hypothetical protein WD036_12680 [Bauldia sp.]
MARIAPDQARRQRATLMIEPFNKPSRKAMAELTAEGLRLLAFTAPHAQHQDVRTGLAR